MPSTLEILARMSPERFQEVMAASPKKFREEVYKHAGIRKKGGAFSLASAKSEERTERLGSILREGVELPEDLVEEIIRNYLYTRRPLLADALDFFEVPHTEGLTDADIGFMEKLGPERGRELKKKLLERHDGRDVDLYLTFMCIKHE